MQQLFLVSNNHSNNNNYDDNNKFIIEILINENEKSKNYESR